MLQIDQEIEKNYDIVTLSVIKHFIQLLRIHQWPKNLFVFSGLLLAMKDVNLNMVLVSFLAFFLFCCISSSVYIVNDIADIKKDSLHPVKRLRPLPSGKIKIRHAFLVFLVLSSFTLLFSFQLNLYFGIIISSYFLLNLFYSFKLKDIVIVDVLIISIGFVLRSISGFLALGVDISIWLILSIAFLTMFLGLNKRKKEIIRLAENSKKHRKNLNDYSIALINEILPMLTACTIISYSFYIIYDVNSRYMLVTIPIVLYGILRYQYLTNQTEHGESPDLVLLRDKPIIFIMILWLLVHISISLGSAILEL
ncbi:decaprenyl-phosphate phosphoribosyltransferase [Chengkuizengella sp. YPA3-1-1]|uniref:Decaprenyl-phosphate phosphoribosyltransferase n=1 Tax=Chengkuizengella marina TaxID=2507566 RepID=A0A6N9Q1V7_9BACL|nr:decaprenyl-phosphate phosphoribosyltransferase [Chengkuizengella marina]